jgi:hypothetical protein
MVGAMRNFADSAKIVNPNDPTSFNNLMTPDQFTNEFESKLFTSSGKTFSIPKLNGNQEVMFGMSEVGAENVTSSTLPYKFDRSSDQYEDLKPLTRSARDYLKDYDMSTLPTDTVPSFIRDSNYNPYFNVGGVVGYSILAGVGAAAMIFSLIMFQRSRGGRPSGSMPGY